MSNEKTNYGLSITGSVRVFRKDKTIQAKNSKKKYDITDVWFNVSEKEEDGTYFNKSMSLLFSKYASSAGLPENNSLININDAFPVITGNGDYRKIALMVTDWEPAEGK